MFKHIIFFKFKDKEYAKQVKPMLEGLVGKVPSLRSMEVGIDDLETYRSWHMSLIATFDDLKGFEEYDVHPDHLKVREFVQTVRTDSAAIDYDCSK